MGFLNAMEILSSGLTAERVRMNVTSSNLANAKTTRTAQGGPYQRRDPVFTATDVLSNTPFDSNLRQALQGVEVSQIAADTSAPRMIHDPGHPDANAEGFVAMPNINMVEEMVNMITSARSYEASITAMRSVIAMARRTLTLGK